MELRPQMGAKLARRVRGLTFAALLRQVCLIKIMHEADMKWVLVVQFSRLVPWLS